MSNTTILIKIGETYLGSLAKDVLTGFVMVGVIGVGWWLGSTAMQWAGFVVLGLVGITMATKEQKNFLRSFEEARKRLEEIEAKAQGK